MIQAFTSHPAENKAFFRKLWNLAIPVSIQAMMFSLLGLIDIMMVGRLGETAVAAVGLGNRIFFFNLILTAALGSGMTVLASQFIGAGDKGGLRRTLSQAILTSLAVSLPFIVLYMLFPEQILGLASSDAELLELGSTYLLITAPSIICAAIVVPLESALRAANDAKTPTRIGFYAILVNIALNYVLIFGALGFPAMGVAGSAWGTTLSRLFQTLLLVGYIRHKRTFLIPALDDIRQAMKKTELKRYYQISIPIILQDGLWAFGVVLYNLIYASMGVNELAVMSAISSIEAILMSLFIGFGIGGSIILSQDLGASQFQRAWRQGLLMLTLAPLTALSIGLLMVFFRYDIVSLFGDFDESTMLMAAHVMIASGLALILRVINFTGIIGLLRSGGDVKASVYINIVGMWGVGLPLAYFAANWWHWPLLLVFICSLGEEITKSILVLIRVVSKKWLNNLIQDKAPTELVAHD
ncbi:multidrug transporter MatE [Endozoicomonas montiporae]|uniref:Multidrug-efflux transporter n=2 Tax=Endozoicomonas montiporae TaxID=1027273 RepID=A0A081NC26_9GAMM|nr:MATE family efflux transporter [Endozoicomonas montiporae]AMO56321.1 MATE efflux family protein [Endozoicomonas montiporae CL-33]KEQ15999.1 multidrug transporter MatE [Endozoicomonas montiporae]